MIRTPTLIAASLLLATAAQAQYARPGTIQPQQRPSAPATAAAAKPAQPAPTTVSAQSTGTTGGPVSQFCFEPMNPQDALVGVLRSYSLLCPTNTRTGMPVRLRASGNELAAESGPPNAWHRAR